MREKINFLLERGVEEVISLDSLREKLVKGKILRIKYGIDPTTKEFHYGYLVNLLRLKILSELGHKVIILLGGFTARFGDPTGKLKTRKLRSKEEVREAAKNYINCVKKIIDLNNIEIRDNSEWYDRMSAEELLNLASHFSHARLIERDMFQQRIKEGKKIGIHELLYPILQAYDSVVLKADVAIGGFDQKFNELLGRELQKEFGQPPQDILLLKTLKGTDGKEKMSQSLKNTIPLDLSPEAQFSKIMSIPDSLIFEYFELLTFVSNSEIEEMKNAIKKGANPKDIKLRLAWEIIKELFGEKIANDSREYFVNVFSKKELSKAEIRIQRLPQREYKLKDLIFELKLVNSKSEAQRLVKEGAVEINSKIFKDPFEIIKLKGGEIVKVGKYRFIKIKI